MALKIEPNQSATAFHITEGATLFRYAVDAQHAISSHPLEWSDQPWTKQDADAARAQLKQRYDSDVADAKARDLPPPAPLPPAPPPLTPEDQKALDQHNKAVADAAARLAEYYDRKAKEKAEADQVAADEALVASLPPQPDPTVRRPLSPAQLRRQSAQLNPEEEAARKRADAEADGKALFDKKAHDDKVIADKAEADRIGNAHLATIKP